MSTRLSAMAQWAFPPTHRSHALADFVALTKPGIVVSNVLMTAVGLTLAPAAPWTVASAAMVGTALLIASCGALNMALEASTDARMGRTAGRPVADGRVSAVAAAVFGAALLVAGIALLASFTNVAATSLGAFACFVYVLLYTPLKRRTWAAVPIGAIAGALPPVIGWSAAGGEPGLVVSLLFAALFVWQMPHFLAIGIRRWRDYADAGLAIGPTPQNFGRSIFWIRATCLSLTAVTGGLVAVASAGYAFVFLGLGAALWMLLAALRPAHDPACWSRRVFLASLAYLPSFTLGAFLPV